MVGGTGTAVNVDLVLWIFKRIKREPEFLKQKKKKPDLRTHYHELVSVKRVHGERLTFT